MFELFNLIFGLLGVSAIVLYVYVAVAVVRMEVKSKNSYTMAVTKALVWPVTIWHTIERLYEA